MNQRILELARQVWPDPNTSHVNHEKFAELIVEKCAGIVQTYMSRFPEDHELTKQIKEHFGVEE